MRRAPKRARGGTRRTWRRARGARRCGLGGGAKGTGGGEAGKAEYSRVSGRKKSRRGEGGLLVHSEDEHGVKRVDHGHSEPGGGGARVGEAGGRCARLRRSSIIQRTIHFHWSQLPLVTTCIGHFHWSQLSIGHNLHWSQSRDAGAGAGPEHVEPGAAYRMHFVLAKCQPLVPAREGGSECTVG